MEVNCIQLINKLNIAARQYRLSPLAQLVFLRIWERHNLNRWEDEWVPYTDADLMHDVQEKSRQRLYRAKMELERVHILLHKTDTNRTQTYTLVALEPQGVEGDACTQSVHKTDISRTSNDTQNRVPSYISIKDIKDKDINRYTPYIPLKGESEGGKKKKVTSTKKPVTFDGLVEDEKLLAALNEFAKFRKEVKKPFTETQLPKFLKKLQGMASDTETQIAILDRSISNGWQGIFPLGGEVSNNGKVQRYMAKASQGKVRRRYEYESDEKRDEFLAMWGDG